MSAWLVLVMDPVTEAGIVRRETTADDCLRWLQGLPGAQIVASYPYDGDCCEFRVAGVFGVATYYVEPQDVAAAVGWDITQQPRYPHADRPYVAERRRDEARAA